MKFETPTPQQMADYGTSAPSPADTRVHQENDSAGAPPQGNAYTRFQYSNQPHSLRDALRNAASRNPSSTSGSTSEEDYDDKTRNPVSVLLQEKTDDAGPSSHPGSSLKAATMESGQTTPSDASFEANVDNVAVVNGAKVYTIASDDKELRDILKKGLQRVSDQ